MVAIVAVRAFGIGGVCCGTRNAWPGTTPRTGSWASCAPRAYQGIERGGLGARRIGDVASSLVADMDSVADGVTRVALPHLVAAAAGAGSAALMGALLPPAGFILLAGVVCVLVGVPLVQVGAARRAQRRVAPLRGELAAQVVELVHGAPDLVAYGAADRYLTALAHTDERLREAEGRTSASVWHDD